MRRFRNDIGEIFDIPESEIEREWDHCNKVRFQPYREGSIESVERLKKLGCYNMANDYSIDFGFEYPEEAEKVSFVF